MNLQNQNGMVSFLVVMFISVLLVLITASFARVMTRELRQSTDSELSSKAYYAAESAVEDSLLDIRRNLNDPSKSLSDLNEDDCNPEEYTQFDSPVGYSCRLVTVEPNELIGELEPDNSRQFNLESMNNNKIKLEWHLQGQDYHNNTSSSFNIPFWNNNPNPNHPNSFAASDWPDETPPIMRLEIISHPENNSFNNNDIKQKVLFMRPQNSSIKNSSVAYNSISPGSGSTRNVRCVREVNNGNYACEITVVGVSRQDSHIVRIKPFYTGTNYRLKALNNNNEVGIPNNIIVIDATGYANDVFRRVQARVPLYSVDTFGQDYVLLSDDRICKRMRISRPPVVSQPEADTNTGCNIP